MGFRYGAVTTGGVRRPHPKYQISISKYKLSVIDRGTGASRMSETPVPGEFIPGHGPVEINENRETREITVQNLGDRPIQVGSHFHFFESNKALEFDRASAFGMRLNVPAGAAVRFEPGEEKHVELVELGGNRRVTGLNDLTNGSVDSDAVRQRALRRAEREGYRGV